MLKSVLWVTLVLILSGVKSFAIVKGDVKMMKGKLNNGLTYYLIQEKGSKKIDYNLIQKTGSSVETHGEEGLAHFVEHVTVQCSFKDIKGSLESFAERNNLKTNASTYKYKIIYNIVDVESHKKQLNDSCLMVLNNWIGGMTFKKDEIQKVRDVIYEEWRSGNYNFGEVQTYVNYSMYGNSKYAGMSTIGEMSVVKNISIPKIKEFYYKWFNTKNMAVVIKGDFDMNSMKSKVVKRFSGIKNKSNATEFQKVVIPDHNGIKSKEFVRNKMRNHQISVMARMKEPVFSKKEDYIENMFYGQIFNFITKKKIFCYRYSTSTPFARASIEFSDLPIGYKQLAISITPKVNEELDALKDVMTCYNDVVNNGLSKQEINDLKKYHKTMFKGSHVDYFAVAENNFFTGNPLYTSNDYVNTVNKICANFSNEKFTNYCKKRLKLDNVFLTNIVAYNIQSSQHPHLNMCEAIVKNNKNNNFHKTILKKVVVKKDYEELSKIVNAKKFGNACQYQFDNGLRVIYQKVDEPNWTLYGISKGGLSTASESELPSLESSVAYAAMNGMNEYSYLDISNYKILNNIELKLVINELSEELRGRCGENSLPELMNYLHLSLNDAKFSAIQKSRTNELVNRIMRNRERTADNQKAFDEEMFCSNLRMGQPWKPNYKNLVTMEAMQKMFTEKFNNASDWTYILTGSKPIDQMKPIVEKYFGSLKSTGQKEQFVDHKPVFQEERESVIDVPSQPGAGLDAPGGTETTYAHFGLLSAKELVCLQYLDKLLGYRAEKELRYKRSGVYNVFVECDYWMTGENPISTLEYNFGCAKENLKDYVSYIDGQIKYIAENVISDEELMKIKAMMNEDEVNYQCLTSSLLVKSLTKEEFTAEDFKFHFNAITAKDLNDFASKFYNERKVVKYLFN